MRKKLIILGISLVLLTIAILNSDVYNFQPITVFKQGTKIGNLELSRAEWEAGYSILKSKLSDPIYLNIDNKSRGVSLEEIGFDINRDKLSKLTQTCKTRAFQVICRKTSNEQIDPNTVITVNEETLNIFLEELDKEIEYLSKNTIISFEDNTFKAVTPQTKVQVKRDTFKDNAKIADFLTRDNVQISLETIIQEDTEKQNEITENLIEAMSYPLLIKYGRNPIYIPGETVNKFIKTKDKEGVLYGYIDDKPIREYVESLKTDYASKDVVIVKEASIDAIQRAMLFRASNFEINNAVVLPLEGKPKTNGELHDVYLEVIKSQQRLYRFENGELVKTYIISTGLTWETPAGDFEVLGKEKMAISYTGNWYMPNYLPVGTVFGYRFGFHAIPYHLDGSGNIYSRDPNSMGSPATGGCIQLTNDDSLELFDWAPVGTPVYIYE